MPSEPYHVGCGAGFSDDRLDAAMPVVDTLIELGGPATIIFETLAERTLALAQLARRRGGIGWDPRLEARLDPILAKCVRHGIRIVGNFGAADPWGAAQRIAHIARRDGIEQARIAIVEGDDLVADGAVSALYRAELDPPLGNREPVAANVYLGAEPIAEALRRGADVVVTGRVADPALVLGPLVDHHGWSWNDWDRLAGGTLAGHLLECGAQVTGGYFADPGLKDVAELDAVGFPIAAVDADGNIVLGKAAGTGGCVTPATVKEQMLYEVHDPAAYLTPDVVLDITAVTVDATGPDRVAVRGARGRPRPATLKAIVCSEGGWIGEAEISYAGAGAAARARLALEIVARRLPAGCRWRGDLIGVGSVFGDDAGRWRSTEPEHEHADVRVHLTVQDDDRAVVEHAMHELTSLYTCGPAGGGGVRTAVRARLDTSSALLPRAAVQPRVTLLEVGRG